MISILQALLVVDLRVIATANEDVLEDSNLNWETIVFYL